VVAHKKTAAKTATVKRSRQTNTPGITADEFLALKNPKGDLTLELEGERVSLTSLDRIYWPDEKITKFQLLSYYLQVSTHLLPFLKNRPAILQRWPRGIKAPMFFQQDLESAPSFIKRVRLTNQQGRELDYALHDDRIAAAFREFRKH
jgi:bifunctional non-homologous end joining protein LigD